eukprot:gene16242-17881_t
MTLQERLGILSTRLRDENEERRKSHVTFEDEEKAPAPEEAISSRPVVTPFSFSSPPISERQGSRSTEGKLDLSFERPNGRGVADAPPKRQGRPKLLGLGLDLPKGSGFPVPEERSGIDKLLEETATKSSFMNIDGLEYPLSIKELEAISDIGRGTCGVVTQMKHTASGKIMAVKKMGKSSVVEEQKRILMDLDVVMKCNDCPYIVTCYGAFMSQADVYICMELMETCLDKLLKKTHTPIPENVIGKVCVSVVKALHYLKEEHGVMHRDVKPSNMLLDANGCIKLCDFGISGRLVDSKAKTRTAGCAAYMAPERIDPPDPSNPNYDVRADVWSLGISLVELATGEFPYKDCTNEFEVLSRIMNEDSPTINIKSGFSREFCDFVSLCLIKNHEERPKFKVLMNHKFIKRYEVEEVDVAGWYAELSKMFSGVS